MHIHFCHPVSRHVLHILFHRLLNAVSELRHIISVFDDNGYIRINPVLFNEKADSAPFAGNQNGSFHFLHRKGDDPVQNAGVVDHFAVLLVIRIESEIGHSKRSP